MRDALRSSARALTLVMGAATLMPGTARAQEPAAKGVASETVEIVGSKASTSGKECIYLNLANLHLKSSAGLLTARATINGDNQPMLIDTGRLHSILAMDAAKKLKLSLAHVNAASKVSYSAYIDDVALDRFFWHKVRLGVLEPAPMPEYGLLAGADILLNGLNKDIEISAPDGQIKIFAPFDCENAFLAYWDHDASTVPLVDLSTADPRQIVTVRINGKEMVAMIDSGSPVSIVNLAAAEKLGITPAASGLSELHEGEVAPGKQYGKVWHGNFTSFSIGNEVIQHPDLAIADLWGAPDGKFNDATASLRLLSIAPSTVAERNVTTDPAHDAVASVARVSTEASVPAIQPDMLLGADFLRAHRMLFAISQRKLYFTYTGGKVFGNVGPAGAKPQGAISAPIAMVPGSTVDPGLN